MNIFRLFILAMAVGTVAGAQSSSTTVAQLPTDPRGMLAAAAPFYDFNDAALKPWHLKATYQLYDENGKPGEQGTFEHWWVAPNVSRSSWTRKSASRTVWHTADGEVAYQATGERLFFVEHLVDSLLFSSLPSAARLDPSRTEIGKDTLGDGKQKMQCAVARQKAESRWPMDGSDGEFYCFYPPAPFLRAKRIFGFVYIALNDLAKMQNRILPRTLTITDGQHKLLTLSISEVNGIAMDDAALVPPQDGKLSRMVDLSLTPPDEVKGRLTKKITPQYPIVAKSQRVSGSVILDVVIGTDGKVKDMRVVSSPSQSLTDASKEGVSQWEYKPLVVNGQAVEVNTLIRSIFSLGG